MRIGILLISDGFSGAERVVKELLEHSKGENYVLFVNNEIYSIYENLGIKTYNLGNVFNKNILKRLIKIKKIAKNVDKIILKEKISVINPVLEYSFLLTLFLKSKSIMIPSLHGEETNNLKLKKKLFQNLIVKKAFNKATKIISISKGLTQQLPQKYKQKIIVIPNGVDTKAFKLLKNIKRKKNIVLFTGRFIELKGIKEILAVAKQLPQYEFWFAGQGELSNLINLPNTKNLGFQKTEDLVILYNRTTICIFPSYREGFPLCGFEAMSCGKAVIATPLGFSEYIENKKDGIIIPAKDEKALKNAIVDLMTNKKKRKLIEKNARQKVLKYSWDKIAKNYLGVLNEK
ncbi:glycosyltransferase family 4 protein [Candidatus Pacearchaeota archaeon]|nr:glycosyltransferase family 4 protein [Candidatus Pacearchaeota archaeon]